MFNENKEMKNLRESKEESVSEKRERELEEIRRMLKIHELFLYGILTVFAILYLK